MAAPPSPGRLRHAALVVTGFVLLFAWVFAQPLTSGRLLAESDLFDQYLPLFRSPALVWSSFEFAGVPAFADPENSAFYPPRWLFAQVFHSWNGFIVSAFVLGGCFTYAYLFHQIRSRAAAAFGAVGFVLSEAVLERVPHANILHAIVWVPLLLLSIDLMAVSRSWMLWLAVAAFAGACCILAGHPQVALYAAYVCTAYAATGLIAERKGIVHWVRLVAAAVGALLLSAVSVVPLLEISGYSVRQSLGFAEFVDYSNTPWQMLSLLFPAITHSGLEAPTYVGLLVLPLAGVGAAQLRSNWRIGFWLVVAVGCLVLGAGDATPLARLMYGLPLYDRFRIVARHLIFASFALNVLAAYGLAAVARGQVTRRTGVIAAALFVGALVGGAVLLAKWPDAVRLDQQDEAFPLPWVFDDAWAQAVVAMLSLAVFVALWQYPRSRLVALLPIVLLSADLVRGSSYEWTAGGLLMPTVEASAVTPSVHARRLRSQLAASQQRFIAVPDSLRDDVVPGLFSRPWQMANAGGYTSLLLQDVATLAMMFPNGRVERTAFASDDLGLDLLAVRYLVARSDSLGSLHRATDLAAILSSSRWDLVETFTTSRTTDRSVDTDEPRESGYTVFENRRALPRAWLASEVLPTTDGVMADALRTSHLRGGRLFDPRNMALVFEGDLPETRYETGGRAELVSIADSLITVNVTSPGGGFLVLSEAYYPGWQARVDEAIPHPVHKTDLALQGITVPAGRHVVTFEFVPRSRRIGIACSAGGVLTLLATMLLTVRRST